MKETFHNRIFRKNYGKIKEVLEIPNLIEIQLDSYEKFLQRDIPAEKRDAIGLKVDKESSGAAVPEEVMKHQPEPTEDGTAKEESDTRVYYAPFNPHWNS